MKILKIRDVKTPNRGTSTSAGIDFYIPNDQTTLTIKPGESAFIPTGIKVSIPIGHALIAFNKSGVAVKKKLLVGACVIDEDYQGEMHIDVKNVGLDDVTLEPGDKIMQFICLPVNYVDVDEVSSLDELYGAIVSERGTGGFGSTGTK